jgi:hypothetical protein
MAVFTLFIESNHFYTYLEEGYFDLALVYNPAYGCFGHIITKVKVRFPLGLVTRARINSFAQS